MITLITRKGENIENPTITDIQKALNDLYVSGEVKNVMENYVSLVNLLDGEEREKLIELFEALPKPEQ